MLTNLHVKNLALIEEAEVEFGPGLNILTGETGAGKSMLLGAVNLALGKKMTRDLVREGADSCLVELIFQIESPETAQQLMDLGAEPEDGQLIITRKVQGSRSISRINGETCTAAQIKRIASLLLDVHGQHEHQSLLYPEHQLEILDAYGRESLQPRKAEMAEAFRTYREQRKALEAYQLDTEERARELSFLEFEISEIEEAALQAGEEEELEQRYRRMSNGKAIAEALNLAHRLTGYEEGAGDRTGRALRELDRVAEYDDALRELASTLTDIDSLLNDFNREISSYLDDFTFSEAEFYEVENRLDQINRLKAKYGASVEAVLASLEQKQTRREELLHFEERKAELEQRFAAAEQTCQTCAEALSAERARCAAELSGCIVEELHELNFPEVRFEILITQSTRYRADGVDEIEFRISPNPGEPLRPLAKIASGGELSRIMLAIKTLLADRDEIETLIFDEIDTGISGRTAQRVSEKMAKIARHRQVLCITHLAQIAAMADQHFEIAKETEHGETVTRIRLLPGDASVTEIARILGGAEITDAVRQTAQEMKALAEQYKTAMIR